MSVKIDGYELPAHISYSSLTTWIDCGFKYYLSRIVQESGSASWWLAGGSAVHEASEIFDKKLFEEEGK